MLSKTNTTSKATECITNINSEEVKQAYLAREDDFVPPYVQKVTELVERATNAESTTQTAENSDTPQQVPEQPGLCNPVPQPPNQEEQPEMDDAQPPNAMKLM